MPYFPSLYICDSAVLKFVTQVINQLGDGGGRNTKLNNPCRARDSEMVQVNRVYLKTKNIVSIWRILLNLYRNKVQIGTNIISIILVKLLSCAVLLFIWMTSIFHVNLQTNLDGYCLRPSALPLIWKPYTNQWWTLHEPVVNQFHFHVRSAVAYHIANDLHQTCTYPRIFYLSLKLYGIYAVCSYSICVLGAHFLASIIDSRREKKKNITGMKSYVSFLSLLSPLTSVWRGPLCRRPLELASHIHPTQLL